MKVDPTSGHAIQCIMDWGSPASYMTAINEDGEEIMGDVKNYTTGTPVSVVGEVVASG